MTKHIKLAAMAALAGIALVAPKAQALTYNDGDLLLGFHATGGSGASTEYIIDLGSFTNFTLGGTYHTGQVVNLNIAGIAADLSSTYGADWFSNSTTGLTFGIAGTYLDVSGNGTVTANTLFASRVETTNGTASTAWNRANTQTQSAPANLIENGLGATFGTLSATGNNSAGALEANSTTAGWTYYMKGGAGSGSTTAFNYGTFSGGIEGTVSASNNVLDLYEMIPGSGKGALVGAFDITSNGTVQFSSDVAKFAAVPEPSTYAMGAVGAVMMAGYLRRKARKA